VAAARLAVACGCLAVGPGLERFASEVSPAPQLVAPAVKGWRKSPTAEDVWRPTYPGAGAELYVSFERIGDPRQRVVAYAAYYGQQRPGRKLIGYDSSMVGAGWENAGRATDGATLLPETVRELELSTPSGRRRLVWMWYEVRGQRLLSPAAVRFAQALAAFGWPSRSGVAAISMECESTCETARHTLREAYRDGLVALHAGTAEPR
jgi:EpsI family protein